MWSDGGVGKREGFSVAALGEYDNNNSMVTVKIIAHIYMYLGHGYGNDMALT